MNSAKSAAVIGAVNAVLALLLAFGIDVSEGQQVAIVGAVNAALVLVAAWRDPSVSRLGPNGGDTS
jgi:hypothetical protein